MSMHRYANAGPVMHGLAAMVEIDPPIEPMPVVEADDWGDVNPTPMMLDIWRGIQNVADQLSEVAAQLVDVRQRLDALDKRTAGQQLYGGIAQQQLNPYFTEHARAQQQYAQGLASLIPGLYGKTA